MPIKKPTSISYKLIAFSSALVLFTTSTVGGLALFSERNFLINSETSNMEHDVNMTAAHILARIQEFKSDVTLINSTPPIQGIIRATRNQGLDVEGKSNLVQWKQRLSTIFSSVLLAKPDYLQIRLISATDNGKELVRVERRGSKIVTISGNGLQSKGSRSYVKETLSLTPEATYMSKFTPNEEYGKVVKPIEIVFRIAQPIYPLDRKKPFGLLVINISYNKIFEWIRRTHHQDSLYFIADQDGNIIRHSNPRFHDSYAVKGFTNISKYMPELKAQLTNSQLSNVVDLTWGGSEYAVAMRKIYHNPISPDEYLSVVLLKPLDYLVSKAYDRMGLNIALIIILLLGTLMFSARMAHGLTKPIKKLITLAQNALKHDQLSTDDPDLQSTTEVSALANTLSNMVDNIRNKNLALYQTKDALDKSAIVVTTDGSGRIIDANKKFLEISGFSIDEVLGQTHRIVKSGYHDREFYKDMWRTIVAGYVWQGEVCNRSKSGSLYWVDTTIYPILEGKKPSRFIAIRFDITEQKRAEKDLLAANEETLRLAEAKSSFLANMSHEIRTPLNGILGFTEELGETELDSDQQKQLATIKSCSNHLLALVNDFLDFSKIESGKLELEIHEFDLNQLLTSILALANQMLEKKAIDIQLHVKPGIPKILHGDSTRLKQVIINLLSNAIKFTDNGIIKVTVDAKHIGHELFQFFFEVEDHGIGISQDKLSTLFQDFTQADSSTTRVYGGTGLGLSICKKLCNLMGGDIKVSSKLGEGATFSFDISCKAFHNQIIQPSEDAEKSLPHFESFPLQILVVEDNEVNQRLLCHVLKKLGYDPALAVNGQEAVEACQTQDFDLVLMDLQMPVMDGITATSIILEEGAGRGHKPAIVGLTANATTEDRDLCLNAGMSDFLTKPLRKNLIGECLLKTYQRIQTMKAS